MFQLSLDQSTNGFFFGLLPTPVAGSCAIHHHQHYYRMLSAGTGPDRSSPPRNQDGFFALTPSRLALWHPP